MPYQPIIYIAGHRGMVGSAIIRNLQAQGYTKFITRTHAELELTNQEAVRKFFESEKPEQVYLAAAKVGGIHANNTYPAEFIYDNLMVQANVIDAAFNNGVKKLLFLGSSCIYPKLVPQPMSEDALLTGTLEPTNEPYAIAKISGIKMCENYYRQYSDNFISVMPTNLYGPNDNFDLQSSHVLPALIRKIHESKVNNSEFVEIWGSGNPKREFLYVDDLADACVFCLENIDAEKIYDKMQVSHINIGCGEDLSIAELASMIAKVVDYKGEIRYDPTKLDGTPQKLLDISRLKNLGWAPTVTLHEGIMKSYEWYLKQVEKKFLIVSTKFNA